MALLRPAWIAVMSMLWHGGHCFICCMLSFSIMLFVSHVCCTCCLPAFHRAHRDQPSCCRAVHCFLHLHLHRVHHQLLLATRHLPHAPSQEPHCRDSPLADPRGRKGRVLSARQKVFALEGEEDGDWPHLYADGTSCDLQRVFVEVSADLIKSMSGFFTAYSSVLGYASGVSYKGTMHIVQGTFVIYTGCTYSWYVECNRCTNMLHQRLFLFTKDQLYHGFSMVFCDVQCCKM